MSEAVAALLADLAAHPAAWSPWEALRRLEAADPARRRLGRSARPAEDAIRIAQEAAVEFAPAAVAALEPAGADEAAPRLLLASFGMFGPDGPLPLHLTEWARDRRRRARDPTLQRFVDIFHHRLASLFFRAWADGRPTVSFDRPAEDRFGTFVASLAGLGTPTLRDRDAMPDLAKLHFAGLLGGQTRHADGLAAILGAFFAEPVSVECFVGCWLVVPPADQTRLGRARENATLGGGAMLGAASWTRQEKFRVRIGPLSLASYRRLLPGSASFARLVAIVRNYAGDLPVWDANLVLRHDEVPPLALGRGPQLGWTAWLGGRMGSDDRGDLLLDASADGMSRCGNGTDPLPVKEEANP